MAIEFTHATDPGDLPTFKGKCKMCKSTTTAGARDLELYESLFLKIVFAKDSDCWNCGYKKQVKWKKVR